jgi:hypothetical protein
MSAQLVQKQISDQERQQGFREPDPEVQPACYCLPILPWDEIVQKWPKVRFASFFPVH